MVQSLMHLQRDAVACILQQISDDSEVFLKPVCVQEGLQVTERMDLHAVSVAFGRREGHRVNWKLPGGAGGDGFTAEERAARLNVQGRYRTTSSLHSWHETTQ